MSDGWVLVTGATGKTGTHVVSGLRGLGHAVRAATRRPAAGDGDAVPFDWADHTTFSGALADVRAIYLVAPAGVADPLPLVRPFLELAAAGGVRRVVQLSSSAVARGEPALGQIHDAVASLFDEYTVLRPSWFMQNFVGEHLLGEGIRRNRELTTATGDGRLGFIDAADIAAVAVQALVSRAPIAEELVLTGPEALSYPQAAAIVAEVIGAPVTHVDLTTAELTTRLVESGLPPDFAPGLAALDERIRRGEQDFVTTAVRDVTGRAPTSLRDFLTRHAELLTP